ncbi:MAG: transcription termination/antitermination protein NusA [Nitrospira sp.]|nr:transcription termination/antitermination protein NusA [Nitrospira sp.]MBS0155451.1 transcription termination/antitermination protein NusA [Nitrospira sp.]MBS0167901.1 transcription termination/antitermination protein NusA [Nitrospira sp.]MBX3325379.1 transcription termination/antitermination protein NusA [Nitrospira sp.]
MNRELISVIDEIGRQKGIDKARVIGAIESALQTAAKKRFGQAENIQVEMDPKTGEISVVSKKIIVETVSNPKAEISLQEARQYDSEAEVGDEIGSLIEMNELGRIAAQTAKQVIFQKVREAEWEAVQKEYSTRQGDLVTGIILGMERRNYLVDLGKTEALLPIQEQIPRETYRRGDRVKAMLLEVRRTPKDVQVILSRSHPQFVAKLFELEVPEIMEKIIEIKSVVREPGDRTKIAVTSREKAVDPVGACVGIKGSRVQAVVRELRGEKIDIITWTQDPRVFIAEALNPATIEKVGIDEEKKSALVVAADSQLSLAIGKNGQNVRLAARLTGWKIDIISATEYEKEKVERDKEIKAALAEEAEAQRLQEEARQAARAEEATSGSE